MRRPATFCRGLDAEAYFLAVDQIPQTLPRSPGPFPSRQLERCVGDWRWSDWAGVCD